MKLHIENINITLSGHHPPAGLIAALAIAGAAKSDTSTNVPEIGEKWPGTDATYAGVSLSLTGDSLVHLLLWDSDTEKGMAYDAAVKHAEAVNPAMASHLPTRHQSIDLFERLANRFEKDPWYWTLTKTTSGQSAFFQDFSYGLQVYDHLSEDCRVRAVSEIPL